MSTWVFCLVLVACVASVGILGLMASCLIAGVCL